MHHYQKLLFKSEQGMHIKTFKNVENFKIFEIVQFFQKFFCFTDHFYRFKTQQKYQVKPQMLSEFFRQSIGNIITCEYSQLIHYIDY